MSLISDWTAKRAGPGITIRGTREGLPVKLVNVASVTVRDLKLLAVMKDGAEHRLAAM
jgi:hypothetical protein